MNHNMETKGHFVRPITSQKKIASLQVVRAMAFLGVYLYHAIRTFPGQGSFYHVLSLGPGPWGVSVFFVLSGFVMTYSYWDRPPQKTWKASASFACKKVRKLYPLHLTMLLIGSTYLLLHHSDIVGILKRLLITIPLVQVWVPGEYQAINTVAWYLSVSLFLYFMFPHLLSVIKNGKAWSSVAKIVVIYCSQIMIGYCVFRFTTLDIKWITYCHPLYRLGDFVIGGFLAAIYENTGIRNASVSKCTCSLLEIIALVLSILACVYYAYAPDRLDWFTYTSLFIPTSILLVYAFSFDKGIVSSVLKNKIVYWLADISPYAFLIHRLVFYYFRDFVEQILHLEHLHFAIVIIVSFIATVALAYFFLFVEKRIIRRTMAQ